jgi:hypothetical protein
MLHQSSGKVGVGEMVVSFPLRFPHVVGRSDHPVEGCRYRAAVASFRATSDEVNDSVYQAKMWLSFSGGDETYQSRFNRPFAVGMTPGQFGDRLVAFNDRAKSYYPYMSRVPSLRYDETSELLGNFTVTLPPFSCLYSDARGFWDTLGFSDLYRDFPGAKMKNAAAAAVITGFSNRHAWETEFRGSDMVTVDPALSDIYEAFAGGAAVAQPKLEFRYFTDVLPMDLAQKRALNKTAVSDGLASLLDDGLRLLSVDESAVHFEFVGKNLVFKSREFQRRVPGEGGTVTVYLQITGELKSFLKMTEDTLAFPLDDPRSYQVEPRDQDEYDALEGHYPVTMLLQQGEASSYVEGRGFCSVLGVLREVDDVIGSGTVVYGDCDELTVRFLDKKLRPVSVRESLTCFLTLELTNLF